jgi:WD40 repeat protein
MHKNIRVIARGERDVAIARDYTAACPVDCLSGAHAATLTGHAGIVYAFAVDEERLFSASGDGTIRVWGLGTWAALRTVEVCRLQMMRVPCSLAVCDSKLVIGLAVYSCLQAEVQVWDLDSLDLQHTLLLPTSVNVMALLSVEGAVWAGVGRHVVVWGRRA